MSAPPPPPPAYKYNEFFQISTLNSQFVCHHQAGRIFPSDKRGIFPIYAVEKVRFIERGNFRTFSL